MIEEEVIANQNLVNINKIKSTIILKKVISLLFQNQKFSLFQYNKKIQKKLDIDIEDYIFLSQRYKVAEKNGKGKEYSINTNVLVFEGEYLNGKRNGKGEEYYENGNLKFTGEYLNGKIINGKKLNIDGYITCIIENGKGKEFYKNKNLRFEGEYLHPRKYYF